MANTSNTAEASTQLAAPAQNYKETSRRRKAVELLLAMGYRWDNGQWREPADRIEAAMGGDGNYFVVWNKQRNEAYVTDDKSDAEYVATGEFGGMGFPTAGDAFRNCYVDDGDLIVEAVFITAQQAKESK